MIEVRYGADSPTRLVPSSPASISRTLSSSSSSMTPHSCRVLATSSLSDSPSSRGSASTEAGIAGASSSTNYRPISSSPTRCSSNSIARARRHSALASAGSERKSRARLRILMAFISVLCASGMSRSMQRILRHSLPRSGSCCGADDSDESASVLALGSEFKNESQAKDMLTRFSRKKRRSRRRATPSPAAHLCACYRTSEPPSASAWRLTVRCSRLSCLCLRTLPGMARPVPFLGRRLKPREH